MSERELAGADYALLVTASRRLVKRFGSNVEAAKVTVVNDRTISDYANPDRDAFMRIDVAADLQSACGKNYITEALIQIMEDGAPPKENFHPLKFVQNLLKEATELSDATLETADVENWSQNQAERWLAELQDVQDLLAEQRAIVEAKLGRTTAGAKE